MLSSIEGLKIISTEKLLLRGMNLDVAFAKVSITSVLTMRYKSNIKCFKGIEKVPYLLMITF
jgi:hypothetical protein